MPAAPNEHAAAVQFRRNRPQATCATGADVLLGLGRPARQACRAAKELWSTRRRRWWKSAEVAFPSVTVSDVIDGDDPTVAVFGRE